MYPICIPDGRFSVQEGATVNMSCTTEIGNPPVLIHILTNSTIYEWTYITVGNERIGSLNLSVNATNQGFSYECKITSTRFPGMERSCTMGPISNTSEPSESSTSTTLHQSTSAATEITNSPIIDPSTDSSTRQPESNTGLPIAIIAGAGGAGGLILLIVLTLVVLYVCKCCCFNDKPGRPSSLWLTDLPLDEPTQDPQHTNPDFDHSEPKMSTSVYQNVTDMQENKVDPRMPPQSAPESPHLDPHDDEAEDFISQRKFSTHSENNEHGPKSPGVSSFKLTRSDDRITDKEDGEHLGAVEPDEGDAPMYGVVKKPNRVSKEIKKKPPEVASDVPDPWANASLDQHENMNPASTESEYAEVSSLSADQGLRGKPTAMVKPVSHTPKPPVHPKPVTDRQSSRRTNTNQAPPSVDKKPVKKFTPSQRNPLGDEVGKRDEAPLPTPVAPGVHPQPPPPASPLVDHEENASVEEYGEEGGHEVPSETQVPREAPSDTQVPHEAHAPDDHDVTYAELEFQSATSDAMPEPQEEQTVYASITTIHQNAFIVEWSRHASSETQFNEEIVAPNGQSLNKYTLNRNVSETHSLFTDEVQTLTFTANRNDTSFFTCRLRLLGVIIATDSLLLPVLYFPSAIYPICFPNGPLTVQEGATVNMSCTTERGNPPVQVLISSSSTNNVIRIPTADLKGEPTRSVIELTLNASDDGSSFECRIVSTATKLNNSENSCIFGPITVLYMTTEHEENKILATTAVPPTSEMTVFQTTSIWILVSVLVGVSCILVTFFLIRHCKITKKKETKVAKADHYTELQPTDDENTVYIEPTTTPVTQEAEKESQEDGYLRPLQHPKVQIRNHQVAVQVDTTPSSEATTTQDTHYQTVEEETGSPDDDYLRPRPHDLKEQRQNHQVRVHVDPTPNSRTTNTQDTYYQPVEVDKEIQEDGYARPDDPKEQRKNHQVSVHVEPTPSSEATGTQHTYYQPGETDSPEYDYALPAEGSTSTSYEAARQQCQAERPHQNINNSNNNNNNNNNNEKRRRVGVVVRPVFDFGSEGITNISQAARKPENFAEKPHQNVKNNNTKRRLGVVFNPTKH
ncbi:uncharacterized protein LOC117302677 [Asterias rubens]|uniref:uncharacterized protein LOC117302677 n=1 Tax=Asterias rubens TaxID=7604 RepID=UPI0014553BCF|nr:uncharacterized protein LOC117302677 [Asterias rubens]